MPQPFEDSEARYLVLVNDRNEHCLWPVFAVVPPGWRTACEPGTREAALAYVRENWVEVAPA